MSTRSRPSQVNLAMMLIIGGSVSVIATAWERVGGLHTMEVQEQLANLVAHHSFGGLTVSGLATILRVLCIIGAAAAAAAAILAGQVSKRSRSARVGLTALAPLVLLGWFGTSGFFEPFVLVGIALLWLPPTADWYAGRDPAARARILHAVQQPLPPVPGPYGAQVQPPAAEPVPAAQPWVASAYHPLTRRPASLVRACVVTWVCCGLTAIGVVAAMVWLGASGDAFVNDIIDQSHKVWGSMADSLTETQVRVELYVFLAGFLVWCLVGIGLAVLAWFGHSWARVLLIVSSIASGVCALLGTLGFPPLLLVVAGCVVATVQLLRPDAATWKR